MIRILTLIILMSNLCAQAVDINALRRVQSQIGLSNSTSKEQEIYQSKSDIILDKVVDPDKYFVGPGDFFRINIIRT